MKKPSSLKNRPSSLLVQSTSLTTKPAGTPKSIYDNKNYYIVVGRPPASQAFPNPIDCYLIVNKETGITEYWESILFYAKQNADQFSNMLEGKRPENPWEAQEMEVAPLPGEKKPTGSFN